MTAIIGLLGPIGSGKTTIADHLVREYGAQKYALAEPLKRLCMLTFGFSHEQLYGTQAQKAAVDPRHGISARQALQRLGQAIRDVLGPDLWWRLALDKIRAEAPALAVVEDVRYANEAAAFMNHRDPGGSRGQVWRLRSIGDQGDIAPLHQSESEWRDASYSLDVEVAGWGIEALHRAADIAAEASGLRRIR